MLVDSAFDESLIPGLQTSAFTLCPHMAIVEREGEAEREGQKQSSNSLVSFLMKALVPLHWELGLQHRNLWGDTHAFSL